MTIETKYNIGDKVYFIIKEDEYDYYGNVVSTTKRIEETTITYIETMMFDFSKEVIISYGDNTHYHCLEKYVFATKEDAEKNL